MTDIILARHGETDWNSSGVFRGRADMPLNDEGRRQAELLGKYLAGVEIDAVYSSPLQRALQTAQAIAAPHRLDVASAPGLIDLDFGEWQGLSLEEVKDRYHDVWEDWIGLPGQVRLPGGECLEEVRRRALDTAAAAIDACRDGGTVVLVSHRVVCKVLICALLGLDNSHFWNVRLDTCAITGFSFERDEFTLNWHNDTSFLRPPGRERPADF